MFGLKKNSDYGNSAWWASKYDTSDEFLSLSGRERETHDLYKLAAHRKAIANFVSIVTGKNIPVKFSTKGDSYTDGTTVTISSDISKPADFDPTVGLALHEGSHILLSDFVLLKNLLSETQSLIGNSRMSKLNDLANTKKVEVLSTLSNILNWVEDRRIDQFLYKQAPGYRDYYRALYKKYFNDPLVDAALKSGEYTDETLDSYLFRLINLQSEFTDLKALKELPKISKIANLPDILRLKTTTDALGVAVDIFETILNAIDINDPSKQKNKSGDAGDGDGEGGDDSEGEEISDEDLENMKISDGASGKGKKVKLTPKQLETLKKKIQNQKDFINGKVNKKQVSAKQESELELVDKSGTEIKQVGSEYGTLGKKVDCIVVNKMTESLMASSEFPLAYGSASSGLVARCEAAVDEGIRLGNILGKKLQTRSESRETVFNRQSVGKIDKRMISSIGYGNELVFFTKEIDQYKKANLHVSVDASGSMDGIKFKKTMTNVVALCKAVDMISNLQIQVSFRTTTNDTPYIVIAYDSRVDKFSKVKQLFKYLRPANTTPEGLCFEAILNKMVSVGTDVDSYFLNISDGEPYFSGKTFSYSGNLAADHTKKMVDKIEAMGIKVLSYFISEYAGSTGSSADTFRRSYGKAASFINVTNVGDVTRTMNGLFMKK